MRRGASPRVPITSSWSAWPTSTIVRPSFAYRMASRWTFVTRGHVASITRRRRAVADSRTAGDTPWALKITVAPVRHLVELVHEDGALFPERLDHVAVVDDLAPDVDRAADDLEGLLDDLDGPLDAGAEAPRPRQHDLGERRGAGIEGCSRPAVRMDPQYRGRGPTDASNVRRVLAGPRCSPTLCKRWPRHGRIRTLSASPRLIRSSARGTSPSPISWVTSGVGSSVPSASSATARRISAGVWWNTPRSRSSS